MKSIFFLFAFLGISAFVQAQVIQVDSSFGASGDVWTGIKTNGAQPVIFQPDGKFVVLGYTGDFSNFPTAVMKRYLSDGSPDTSFATAEIPQTHFQSGALLQDGKYLCMTGGGMHRYLSDGSADPDYIKPTNEPLALFKHAEMKAMPNGKVVSCGNDASYQGFSIAVNKPDGTLDSSFAQNGIFHYHQTHSDLIYSIAPQPDGKILGSGCSVDSFGFYVAVYRWNEDGTLDETFANHGKLWDTAWEGTEGFGMALQTDGKIVVSSYRVFANNCSIVFRYMPDGQRDLSFGVFGVTILPDVFIAEKVIVLPNGRMIVMGETNLHKKILIGLTADGNIDPYFAENGYYTLDDGSDKMSNYALNPIDNNSFLAVYYDGGTIPPGVRVKRFLLDFNVGVLEAGKEQNWMVYPNPLSEQSRLKFSLKEAATLSFSLYDMNGKLVSNLMDNQQSTAGEQEISVPINASLPAGNYVVSIRMNGVPAGGVQVFKP